MTQFSKDQLIQIKHFLNDYENYIFEKYSIRRDDNFRPYYYDEYLQKFIYHDDLVQKVVRLDGLLSILDSVSIK